MPETAAPAVDFSADADLISFLKAIPDGRYRRGVHYPQWYLLLVTVLGIISDCRSSRDLEAFAKRHRQGCLKVDSSAVLGELNTAQREHSFDVVRQRAQTPSN